MTVSLTAQDVTAMGLGDRFQDLLDLLKRLRDFDLTKLRDLLEALAKVQQLMVLEDKIKASMDVLKIGASITPTDIDDKVVAVIDELMTDEMVAVIAKLIRMAIPSNVIGARAEPTRFTGADVDAVQAKGIPWGLITQLVPIVIEIVKTSVKK
jgi:hypothetical protein